MVNIKSIAAVFLLAVSAVTAKSVRQNRKTNHVDPGNPTTVRDRAPWTNYTAPIPKIRAYQNSVSLPIDHTGVFPGTFKNRYWVSDEFYEPGGPIFIYDTGEGDGGQDSLPLMTNSENFFYQFLKEFKGLGIVWEHRYYGKSLPFGPVSRKSKSSQMRFLTVENALKDFVVFADGFKWKRYAVSPKQAPWVFLGGSYPGMRAAMMRQLYPDTVYASYASSAPVQARKDMTYQNQIYRGMVKNNLKNCTVNIKHAIDYIDRQLDHPATASIIKQRFLGRTAEQISNGNFAQLLGLPWNNWQDYGVDPIMRGICDYLEEGAGNAPVDNGSDAVGEYFAFRWANYQGYFDLVSELLEGYCEGPTRNGTETPDCSYSDISDGWFVSWMWQYCTEFGFFQTSSSGLGSRYDSVSHEQQTCYNQFPDGLSSGYLPVQPRSEFLNSLTDGWFMRPSNVFWTGGEFDPWRAVSPLSNETYSPRFEVTHESPACGVPTDSETVFGYLLPNSEHCFDFRNIEEAREPMEMFKKALRSWLPCFKGQ